MGRPVLQEETLPPPLNRLGHHTIDRVKHRRTDGREVGDVDEVVDQTDLTEPAPTLPTLDEAWAQATGHVAAGDREAALICFLALCGRFPEHTPSYVRAGELLIELGRPLQAEPLLADAVAKLPPNEWLLRAYASCGRATLPPQEAEARLRQVAEIFPQFGPGRADLAAFLLSVRRDVVAAEMEAECALTILPDQEDAWVMDVFALCAEARQDWPQAASRWHSLRMWHPLHLRAYHGEARVLNQLGRERDSERTCRAGLALYPHDFLLHRLLAEAATQRRDWQAARDRWRDVRLRQVDDLGGWLGEAEALVHLGEPHNAETILADGMTRHPTRRELALEYARMAERRADWPEAALRWADAQMRFPDEPAAWQGGIAALRATGQEAAAEALEAAAYSQFPGQPDYAAAWARQAEQAGDGTEARRRYAVMRDSMADLPTGWIEGARLAQQAGELDEADALLCQAVTLLPRDLALHRAWADSAARRGDAVEASRRQAKVHGRFPEADAPEPPTEAPSGSVKVPRQAPAASLAAKAPDEAAAPSPVGPSPQEAPTAASAPNPLETTTGAASTMAPAKPSAEAIAPDAPAAEARGTAATPAVTLVAPAAPAPETLPAVPGLPERLATLWRDDFAAFGRTLDALRAETDTPAGAFTRAAFQPVVAPPQASLPLRPRIAVLVSGHLGRFREANRSWPLLRFGTAETTLFVHAWWSGEMLTDALLGGFYGTSHVAMEDPAATPFAGYSDAQRDHHKLRAAWQMMLQTKQSYDIVVRLQPGLMTYGVQDLDWSDILAQSLRGKTIFTDAAKSLTGHTPSIGGRFAAGAQSLMAAYAGTWERQQAQAVARLPLFPNDHAAGSSPGAALFYAGIDAQPMPHVLFDPA